MHDNNQPCWNWMMVAATTIHADISIGIGIIASSSSSSSIEIMNYRTGSDCVVLFITLIPYVTETSNLSIGIIRYWQRTLSNCRSLLRLLPTMRTMTTTST
jgi:hypothetical protein